MDSTPVTSRNKAEALLAIKASTDPAFRARLIENPRAAISSAIGVPLPAAVEVTILEETDRHIYLVLPALPGNELAEEELNRIAGGTRSQDEARKQVKEAEQREKEANDAGKFSKIY